MTEKRSTPIYVKFGGICNTKRIEKNVTSSFLRRHQLASQVSDGHFRTIILPIPIPTDRTRSNSSLGIRRHRSIRSARRGVNEATRLLPARIHIYLASGMRVRFPVPVPGGNVPRRNSRNSVCLCGLVGTPDTRFLGSRPSQRRSARLVGPARRRLRIVVILAVRVGANKTLALG